MDQKKVVDDVAGIEVEDGNFEWATEQTKELGAQLANCAKWGAAFVIVACIEAAVIVVLTYLLVR